MRLSKRRVIIILIASLILAKINYYDTGIYFFMAFVAVVLIKILSDFTAGEV